MLRAGEYSVTPRHFYFFRPGRWVSAEPAAVLAALLERGSRRTFDAADAARLLVTSDLDMRSSPFDGDRITNIDVGQYCKPPVKQTFAVENPVFVSLT